MVLHSVEYADRDDVGQYSWEYQENSVWTPLNPEVQQQIETQIYETGKLFSKSFTALTVKRSAGSAEIQLGTGNEAVEQGVVLLCNAKLTHLNDVDSVDLA